MAKLPSKGVVAGSTTKKPAPAPLTNYEEPESEAVPADGSDHETAEPGRSYESDPSRIGELVLTIPGAPRKPKRDLGRSMIHIYGEPKIGKTTFAADAPGTWFIATEQGQDWVTVREPTLIHSWSQFLSFCAFVQEEKPTRFADGTPIQTFAIDRIEGLFKMCEEYVRQQLGVESLDELGHGKGWARLTNEWERVMNKIRRWPFGLIAISHARQREFKSKLTKVDRWEPDIGAAGLRWCLGAADLILYAHSLQQAELNAKGEVTGRIIERRVIRCHPSSSVIAGGRMADLLPDVMDLDYKTLRDLIEA